jgi:hypothetical protein
MANGVFAAADAAHRGCSPVRHFLYNAVLIVDYRSGVRLIGAVLRLIVTVPNLFRLK